MSVLSLEWLLWMSGTVSVFWITPSQFRQYLLIGITAVFLLSQSPVSLLLLMMMAGVASVISRSSQPRALQIALGISLIVTVLVYFKLGYRIDGQRTTDELLIPLGLSYYALRVIHLILERYMGRITVLNSDELARYLLFLPTLQVGPIHRYGQFKRDIQRHRWVASDVYAGLERIIFGYAKIAVIGNFLISGLFDDYINRFEFTNPGLFHYLDCIRYGANLYVQFSGYSDIAIGFSLLLGYHVMENFNNPFLKKNISEFWRAWHISLTSWCREYVYTAVTAVSRRPALGAIATLLIIGLWHEISWRYLVWGLYHGAGIVVWQLFQHWKPVSWQATGPWAQRFAVAISTLVTFNFVVIGFVFTKESTVAEGLLVLRGMFLPGGGL